MMFGHGAFSEFGFGYAEFVSADPSQFPAFLAEAAAERCWLLEVEAFPLLPAGAFSGAFSDGAFSQLAFSAGAGELAPGAGTLHFSTHGYTSHPEDTPASTWYDGRLSDEIRVDRRVVGRDGVGGITTVFAEVGVVNGDGALDGLLRDYAIDGRPAALWLGRPTDPRSEFGLVFRGIVSVITGTLTRIRFSLSDGMAKLAAPIQTITYAGSGGAEGGADLKGKPKPLCYGKVWNIAPPLIDSVNLIYQVHAGAIQDVPAVYDRGVALVKVGGAPAAGQYQVDTVNGTVKLGATPDGTVTCDVQGDASLSGFVDRTGDIALRILAQQAALTSNEIEPGSFGALNTDAPASVGIWIGTETRDIASVLDELLSGVGAFGGFSRYGLFTVGMVAAPDGDPALELTEEDIISLERTPLPAALEPVVWRTMVGWQQNYTQQADLAASVSAARRTFAAEPQRVAATEDAAIKSRHLLAREYGPVRGLYAAEVDAQAEADRLFDLWSTGRAPYRIIARPKAMAIDIGGVAHVKHRRYGLDAGKAARVLGHAVSGARNQVELTVLI